MRSWNILLHVIGSLLLTVSIALAQPHIPADVHAVAPAEHGLTPLDCAHPLLAGGAPTIAGVKSDMDEGLISSVRSHVAQIGTHVVITGTALCGAGVALKDAYWDGNQWAVNTFSTRNFPATPTKQTPTTIEFAVPNVPVVETGQSVMYILVVIKNSQTVAAPDPLAVLPVPTPRYISSLNPPGVAVPSAISFNHQARLMIHGTGFTYSDGTTPVVVGGVFGNGTISSATNPIFSVANVGPNYVELWMPSTCDEEGLLMLLTMPVGGTGGAGGSPYNLVLPPPGTTITAACMKDVPDTNSYSLVGATPIVSGGVTYGAELKIPPGDQTITVRGPYLRFIKEVWAGLNLPPTKLNFHYTRTSTQPSTVETMTVDVPNAQPNTGFALCLMFLDNLPGISDTCYGANNIVTVNPS
jgi:hypothetical protein